MNTIKPLTIVFLGRSGSGKGTQAKFLMDFLKDFIYIATGDLFRRLSAVDSIAGHKVDDMLKSGILPDDWLAIALWQKELLDRLTNGNQHIIFDGALRRTNESEILDMVIKWFDRDPVIPILIDVTRDEAFKRLKLRGRYDDVDENINKRLTWFEDDVAKVVEFYEKSGRLLRVDGMPSEEKVFQNVLAALGLKSQ